MLPRDAVLVCLVALCAPVVHAQSRADSVRSFVQFRVPEDSLESAPLTADHDLTRALAQSPGSFVYDFYTFAWPSAWSPQGLSPHAVQLFLGPIPFDDLLTGRPRYDLLPTALLRAPTVHPGLPGGATAVQTELRSVNATAPQTQLHYQAGDHKLQRVTALHAQQRGGLFGRSGRLQGLFAYAGASDAGQYPGSRLRRMRQLLLRTRYQTYAWSLELLYLHNQRRIGAHSGVLGAEDTRYNRLIAGVRRQERARRPVRNDLLVTLHTPPLTASVYWSTQSLHYADVSASASRFGGSLHRDFQSDRHRIRARIDGYYYQIQSSSAIPHGRQLSLIEVQLRDSLTLPSGLLLAQAGVRRSNVDWSPSGYLKWESSFPFFEPYIELNYRAAATRSAPGWGGYLNPREETPGNVLIAAAGIGVRIGRVVIEPYGFLTRLEELSDYVEVSIDTVQVVEDSYTVQGAGIRLRFASEQGQGFYASINSGVTHTDRSLPDAQRVLPRWALSGQLGLRTVLFTGDLELNVAVRGRSWSAMTSRTLHAPTGLLVIPSTERLPVQGSYTLDLIAEGGIRTATVYIYFENITSGTQWMTGNELVADYPLPAGQLRFGVYWPITN